jgi:hypothetical protein
MKSRDRPHALEHIRDCLQELEVIHTPEEVRDAARALGMAHHLPDPQDDLPLGPPVHPEAGS